MIIGSFETNFVLVLTLDWVCLTWRLPQLLAVCRPEQLETQAGWPEASFPSGESSGSSGLGGLAGPGGQGHVGH